MPENKKFHDFSLHSILFKGRADWYFCYLKTERIAHVLTVIATSSAREESLMRLAQDAAHLPHEIAHLAAGEAEPAAVLADVYGLLSSLRLTATLGLLRKENARILEAEYERVAERLEAGSHPSPFASAADFFVPEFSTPALRSGPDFSVKDTKGQSIKDSYKGHDGDGQKGQSDRARKILECLRTHKQASIKEIAASVRGCSEKTIQRELGALIDQGLVRKQGERRWSTYSLS